MFVLKIMINSGLEKIFLKFLHAEAIFRLIDLLHIFEDLCFQKNRNSVTKMEGFSKLFLWHMIDKISSMFQFDWVG